MTITIDWLKISQDIALATLQPFTLQKISPISGGSINCAYQLTGDIHHYFIKLNKASLIDMFKAEFDGLVALENTQTIHVPKTVCYGAAGNKSFIVQDMLAISPSSPKSDILLAQQLAKLHAIQQPFFGWHSDNTIGSSKQKNTPCDDWLTFFVHQRLGFQLQLAKENHYSSRLIDATEKLCQSLHYFFNHQPQPSLLHGDLWSGNTGLILQDTPVIYDPACYYGDREADIAMTELFGGFSHDFYTQYQQTYPLDSGYNTRKHIYNLYHILNHLNLFGSSYQSLAQHTVNLLLAELS